ncbi:MAG TPA: mucoidy inhibitor MuiA family protein [Humisphaera sp.]
MKKLALVVASSLLVSTASAVAQTRPAASVTRPATGPGAAADQPVGVPGKVVAVTVYQGSALVTREVDVKGGPGLVEVVVPGLPEQTVDSSLYTEGTKEIRVLSTRYRTRAVRQDTRDEVRAKEEQIRTLGNKAQEMARQLEVQTQDTQLLGKLEGFTGATMKELTEKGVLNPEATMKLATFIMEQRATKAKAEVELQQQIRSNQEQQGFAQRELAELTRGVSRTERDAVVTVDKADAAAGKVRLNYLVNAAGWRPQYKLRAGAKEADAVTLEYLAEIVQQSGEDWANADVVLSTAEPRLNAAPPDLLAMEVSVSGGRFASNPSTRPAAYRDNIQMGQVLRKQAQIALNGNSTVVGNAFNNDAAALEQTAELLQSDEAEKAFVPKEGPSVTYHLKSKLTVPSRNDPQLIEVSRVDLPPAYFYKAVPVLTPHVYRQAVLTNRSDLVLLPGEATMYVGSDFVGRMNLPLVAIGEQFTVGFGVDPQIQVTRQQLNRVRGVQGGNQVQTYDYRIRVQSFKPTDVQVQVWDRLPLGEAEAVGVLLAKTTPELSKDAAYERQDRPKNLLRWDLTLKPGTNGEKATTVEYQFRLEYARDVNVGNFKAVK